MKINIPIFILGLLVIIIPIIGFPQFYEQIILALIGLVIIILVSSVKIIGKVKDRNLTEKQTVETLKGE
jgi:hypothetical protein